MNREELTEKLKSILQDVENIRIVSGYVDTDTYLYGQIRYLHEAIKNVLVAIEDSYDCCDEREYHVDPIMGLCEDALD